MQLKSSVKRVSICTLTHPVLQITFFSALRDILKDEEIKGLIRQKGLSNELDFILKQIDYA